MTKLLRTVSSLGVAALTCLAPVAALAETITPIGVYQTTDRKMDFALALCGRDERELCMTLTAARGSADIPRTRKFLDKLVVDHAKPAGKNRWRGSMSVSGYTVSGTLKLNPGQSFVMSGCAYIVVCQDFTLIPAE
jgi:hypothetical protein